MVDSRLEDEWLSASKALDSMTSNGENPVTAMEALSSYLRLGKLRARAQSVWVSEEATLSQAWKRRPDDAEMEEEVPRSRWRSHKAWSADVANWRWSTSCFHITLRNKPARRRMMRGVEFNLADLGTLQPNYFAAGKRKRRRGPDADLSRRDAVWLELLSMALSGELTDPTKRDFDNQTDLEGLMHQRLNPEGLAPRAGKNLIGEIVRQAFPRLTP